MDLASSSLWAERVVATLLALLVLAVLAPDVAGEGGRAVAVVATYSVVAFALVGCIVVGQRRSRGLRVAGWVLLLIMVVLELRLRNL
jgi:hypothetical protein